MDSQVQGHIVWGFRRISKEIGLNCFSNLLSRFADLTRLVWHKSIASHEGIFLMIYRTSTEDKKPIWATVSSD